MKMSIETFIELGYTVKEGYVYVPLKDYLVYYPCDKKNWLPNMIENTYVMLPIELEKRALKEPKSKTLSLNK